MANILQARAGRRRGALAIALLISMIGVVLVPQQAQAAPGVRVDLRVLLVTDTGAEPTFGAWTTALDREGVPYDVVQPSVDPAITGTTLATSATHANYQGIVFVNQLAWFALDAAEQTAITTYERDFGIRQVTAFVFPSATVGLNAPFFTGDMGGVVGQLTTAGATVFPYLKGPVAIDAGAFGYQATPLDPDFETLLEGPEDSALVGVHTHADGREELVMTVDGNQFQSHEQALVHGMLGWLTRGVYLGHYRQYLELHVDDVLYDNDRWDPVLNTTHEDDGATLPLIRMIPSDVDRALAWMAATEVDLHLLFNGVGSVEAGGASDPLTVKLLAEKAKFYWINHTYEHFDLNTVGSPDPHAYADIVGEINNNIAWAGTNGVPLNPVELVTGEHSGLARPGIPQNPDMAQALTDTGILWIGDDNSTNSTQYAVGSALTVPRHPSNIFYNTATRSGQLDEYNYIFFENCNSGCIPAPVDWAGYVNNEATIMFRHVVDNDPRPHYIHQSNIAEDGVLYDVVNEVLARTTQLFDVPIVQLTLTEAGEVLGKQQAWATQHDSVTAYRLNGEVHLESATDAWVPVSGTTGPAYGGLNSNWFNVTGGVPLVLAISAGNTPPVASDDPGFVTLEETLLTITDVTANDVDFEDGTPDATTVEIFGAVPPGLTNNNDGTFDYLPPAELGGVVTFEYTVRDSDNAVSNPATVTITVTPVNDQPTATNRTQSYSYAEGAAIVPFADIVVTDPDPGEVIVANLILANTATGVLTATAGATYNNGNGLWTITGSVAAVNAALAEVAFVPVPGNNVDTAVFVGIFDGLEDGTVGLDGTITLDVDLINDPPSATNLTQITSYFEDAPSVDFDDIVVTDPDLGERIVANLGLSPSTTGTLTTSGAATYNPAFGAWSIEGSVEEVNAALAAVAFVPAPDNNLDSIIAVSIEDGDEDESGPLAGTLSIDAIAVNDPPSFVKGQDPIVLAPNSGAYSQSWASGLSTGPPNESAQALVGFSVINNTRPDLFTVPPAIGLNGFLDFTLSGVAGSATIEITLEDNGGTANGGSDTSAPATLTISTQNDPPTDIALDSATIAENQPTGTTVGTFSTTDVDSATFIYTLVAGAGDTDNIRFSISGSDLLSAEIFDFETQGSFSIRVQTDDGSGGTYQEVFTITVSTQANIAPSFDLPANPDQTAVAGSGPQTVVGFATNISAGPPDEETQALTFNVSNDGNHLFAAQPALSPTGTLTYTPAVGVAGTAIVTVTLSDNGGTDMGGADTSEAQTFTITISEVDDDGSSAPTVGLVDISQGMWHLRNTVGQVTSFFYGNPGDLPIAGDWDGDGDATPGLFRQSDGFFYARNSNTQGAADAECFAGDPADIPLAGDWDGDGDDNLGIYRPSQQTFYLFTSTCTGSPMGAAQISLGFGNPGDAPVAGDWDGDGIDEIGLYRESTGFFYWRNTLDTGIASGSIFFGDPGDRFVGGDWGIVDGSDTPAIYRPSDATFYFRHTLTQGNADSQIAFGEGTFLPVAGPFGLG